MIAMNWRMKGVLQKALSTVPGGTSFNSVLQRTIGARRSVDEVVRDKFNSDWLIVMQYLQELRIDPAGMTWIELGTGWLPVLPVCFSLAGARRVHSFDLTRHLDAR